MINAFFQFAEISSSECSLLEYAKSMENKSMNISELDKPIAKEIPSSEKHGLTDEKKAILKDERGFSDEIIEKIDFLEESKSFKKVDLQETEIDGNKYLIQKDINMEKNSIRFRNEDFEGKEHPDTGVLFERREVEIYGKNVEVIAPNFESTYDAKLPEDMYEASDRQQLKECNNQLKQEIDENPIIRERFNDEEIEQIENGDTPDGYTWHHDVEAGRMQLVDTEMHQKTGHTGGRSIWGGGTDNR